MSTFINDDADPSGDWQRLDPNYVRAERLGDIIFTSILGLIVLIVWVVIMFAVFSPADWRSWFIGLGGLSFCAVLAWFGWYYPQWHYHATRWRQVHGGFEIQHGVWWWHRIFIPRQRIQHTDVVRGPLMRRFGIAKLIIYTAGTEDHAVTLEGLGAEQAETLRQSLLPSPELQPRPSESVS